MPLPSRIEAWALLCEWIQSDSLRKHVLAVEAAVRAYARRFSEDEELWGVAALLHDLDFERFPDMDDPENGHPRTALRLFRELDYPPELIQAVAGHAPYLGVPRTTKLDAALYAVDELTGLIMAVAYVRPSKDIRDVEISSVKKKWKDKLFAAAVSRADIEEGARELGLDLWEHVGVVLEAMKGIAAELGLDGRLAAGTLGNQPEH
ncbi:MAG: HDIG domain-containing protein [Chloroflexi bacterium]|nr:HDIG domain-containing protein [Chloroflexota bacterium]